MIRLLVLALLSSPICSKPGYRSSVMYGSKPILRLGPDEAENAEADQPGETKEPEWVTNLRTNIQKQIREAGFENSKPDIKELIENADEEINGNFDQNSSPERVPVKDPLRTGYYESSNRETVWEKDLKSFIKEAMGMYGRNELDNYVRPVINAIERQQHVIIQDIDVNPDGDISVNYVRSGGNNYPDQLMYQREGFERFTMAPE